MHTFTIPANTLRAAVTHAAKKDVRYYLVGVLVDLNAGRIVATDGHRMLVCEGPQIAGGGQHILPRDAIIAIGKAKGQIDVGVSLTNNPGAPTQTFELSMGDFKVAGVTVDGTFPDYKRVIPRQLTGTIGQYNADYLADAQSALAMFFGIKKNIAPRLEHNGASPGIMHWNRPGCFALIMPLRTDDAMDRDMAAFIDCVTDTPAQAAA